MIALLAVLCGGATVINKEGCVVVHNPNNPDCVISYNGNCVRENETTRELCEWWNDDAISWIDVRYTPCAKTLIREEGTGLYGYPFYKFYVEHTPKNWAHCSAIRLGYDYWYDANRNQGGYDGPIGCLVWYLKSETGRSWENKCLVSYSQRNQVVTFASRWVYDPFNECLIAYGYDCRLKNPNWPPTPSPSPKPTRSPIATRSQSPSPTIAVTATSQFTANPVEQLYSRPRIITTLMGGLFNDFVD